MFIATSKPKSDIILNILSKKVAFYHVSFLMMTMQDEERMKRIKEALQLMVRNNTLR